MVNTKKEFAAAGQLENDILKPRCSHEVAKPLGTRLRTQQTRGLVVFHQPSSKMRGGKYEMGNNARQQG